MTIVRGGIVAIAFVAVISATAFFSWLSSNLAKEAVKPIFTHQFMETYSIGTHYFVNDLVGISPIQSELPAAVVISHSSRPKVVEYDQASSLTLAAAEPYGISQDPHLPGWGAVAQRSVADIPVSIEYVRTMLVGTVNEGIDFESKPSIEISLPWRAHYAATGGVTVEPTLSGDTHLKFTLLGPGQFWVEPTPPPSDGYAINFKLLGLDSSQVRIGAEQIQAPAVSFALQTRDMHSLAIGELDGDMAPEVSIVRGGLLGELGRVDPDAADILIDLSSHDEVTRQYPGNKKDGCPGRQSGWVDIDNDTDLDLYIVCGRTGWHGKNYRFPNRLLLNHRGTFTESASRFGLGMDAAGAFRFIDWDSDGDIDLWWADVNGELSLFQNNAGLFKRISTHEWMPIKDKHLAQLLLFDYEHDNDPDILLLHPKGNLLIRNVHHTVDLIPTERLGLPAATMAGTLADINLDGWPDLFTATQGVFLGNESWHFELQPSASNGENFVQEARLVSFEGPSGREFIVAYRTCLPGKMCGARQLLVSTLRSWLDWRVEQFEKYNLFEPYTWYIDVAARKPSVTDFSELIIQVEGPTYNPFALGAKVTVGWDDYSVSHWVGESESSLYSQADFAIYASVPTAKGITLQTIWPDGCERHDAAVQHQRRILIQRPVSCSEASGLSQKRNRLNRD